MQSGCHKSAHLDGCHAVRNRYFRQRPTSLEGGVSNRVHVLRNVHRAQIKAPIESERGNACQAARKRDLGQGFTIIESPFTDSRHTLRDSNAGDGGPIKSIFADARYLAADFKAIDLFVILIPRNISGNAVVRHIPAAFDFQKAICGIERPAQIISLRAAEAAGRGHHIPLGIKDRIFQNHIAQNINSLTHSDRVERVAAGEAEIRIIRLKSPICRIINDRFAFFDLLCQGRLIIDRIIAAVGVQRNRAVLFFVKKSVSLLDFALSDSFRQRFIRRFLVFRLANRLLHCLVQ